MPATTCKLLITNWSVIIGLGLPHFHGSFQWRKRKGLCCSCRQQWGPPVMLSHLRIRNSNISFCTCTEIDKEFFIEWTSYCQSGVFCWICSSRMPFAPSLLGMCHHNTGNKKEARCIMFSIYKVKIIQIFRCSYLDLDSNEADSHDLSSK